MAKDTPELATRYDLRLLALTGGLCFPASFVLFYTVLPVGAWAASAPALMIAVFAAALTTMLAMAFIGAVLARRMQEHNQSMRIALNNMAQGLCMFDRNERLVVCNRRYMEMYALPADIVKPGSTLERLLQFRIANGTFSRDADLYRKELHDAMRNGVTTHTEVKSVDGRTIAVANRPMADGG